MVRVGTVVSVARYPVKSMGGEALETAEIHWPWLHGDRQFAFVKTADTSSFPWLTARDVPDLLRYRARYEQPDDPVGSPCVVTDPDGAEFEIRDPALYGRLAETAGEPVGLLRLGRGCFDAMPIALLTTVQAEAVERAHGAAVGVERFRANLVVAPDDPADDGMAWLGRTLVIGGAIGGAALGVDWAIPRCAMIGIADGRRDPALVRTVARRFGNRVGAYCSVRQPDRVAVGNAVVLDPRGDEAARPSIL